MKRNDLYDTSLHHLVYQMMNLWLTGYSSTMITWSCALSLPLLCFGSSIFLKVSILQGSAATRFDDAVLSQIFQKMCQWKYFQNPLRI